jgi:hypothetical protein
MLEESLKKAHAQRRTRLLVFACINAFACWLSARSFGGLCGFLPPFITVAFVSKDFMGARWRLLGYVRVSIFLSVVLAWTWCLLSALMLSLFPLFLHTVLYLDLDRSSHSTPDRMWQQWQQHAWLTVMFLVSLLMLGSGNGRAGIRRALVHVFYDAPAVVVVYTFHLLERAGLGRRINSLYSAVDDTVLLGALPFAYDVAALQRAGVKGVVNMCAEWSGPQRAYERAGITQLRLQTTDYSAPELEACRATVDFVRTIKLQHPDGRVFIHCKCGMGRSATVAAAYLLSTKTDIRLPAVVDLLRAKRQEVAQDIMKGAGLRRFANELGKLD